MLGNLCIRPGFGVDVNMYRSLMYDLSLDDAFALEDIDNVDRAARDAAEANSEWRRKHG